MDIGTWTMGTGRCVPSSVQFTTSSDRLGLILYGAVGDHQPDQSGHYRGQFPFRHYTHSRHAGFTPGTRMFVDPHIPA